MPVFLLHVLFFLTGLSGLVYEVIWTRMLGHVVGNSTQAIGLVLAAFMAGLAIGSLLVGRWADKRRDPLKIYAFLEIGVALCALAIPFTFGLLVTGYVGLHQSFESQAPLIGAARFVVAFVLLVVPTVMMGATLPVLARFAVREIGRVGGRIGTLYGINTLGAMLGAALSGFVLMRLFGISGANTIAVGINLAVAAAALALHRHTKTAEPATAQETAEVPDTVTPDTGTERMYVLLFGLSGMVALALEVLWTKSLSFFLGSTTQAFATMLSTFLLGLALGAFVISRRVDALKNPHRAVGTCLLGIGAAGLVTLPLFGFILNRIGLQDSWGDFLVAAAVMLPATLFMGAMLPLVARIYVGGIGQMGRRIGRMYAVNTVGAILGSILAAFVFIPLMGIQGSILAMCALAIVAGGFVLVTREPSAHPAATLIQAGGAVLLFLFFTLTASDRFFSVLKYDFRPGFADEVESLFYEETSTGIVEVTREDAGFYSYKIDGINQAKTSRMGQRVHNLLGQLGLLLHPHPKDVLMVALGGGTTVGGTVPFDPLYNFNSVEVVEINPAIVKVAGVLADYNNHVLEFPKLKVNVEDGRNFLLTTPRKYDVIVTGVIHPKHSAGNASMYGRDYYELVKNRLKPGGVVVQWLPANGVRVREFKAMVATFVDAFPHGSLWFAQTYGGFLRGNNNLIVVGSPDPLPLHYPSIARKLAHPSVKAAFGQFGVETPEELLDTFITDADGMRAYAGDAEVVWDEHSILEFLPLEEHASEVVASLIPVREPIGARLTAVPPQIRQELMGLYTISQRLMTADNAAERGRFEVAMAMYDEVVRAYPEQPDVAEAYRQITHLARYQVTENAKKAAAKPDSEALCIRHGASLVVVKAWNKAARELARCSALNPDNVDTYIELGRAHFSAGNVKQAAKAWGEAVRLAPDRHELHFNLGLIAERTGRPNDALTHFTEARRLAPKRAVVRQAMARSLIRLGRVPEAVSEAMVVLQLQPDNEWARRVLESARREGIEPRDAGER
ncbi:MAG: fused MFS/spermidine synthase [Leptospirillia bacterium]